MQEAPRTRRIGFRADASSVIGSGHVMRCLTLSDALAVKGMQAEFFCRLHDAHLMELIEKRGYRAHGQPADPTSGWLGATWEMDALQTVEALMQAGPLDWLVVDHYAIDTRWEHAVRAAHHTRFGCDLEILAIDDLADRPHECSMLLDQNLHVAGAYDQLIPKDCTALLGPLHALLRPEFASAYNHSTDNTRHGTLVYFGAHDPHQLTLRALRAFSTTDLGGWLVHVVVAPNDIQLPDLKILAAQLTPSRCRILETPQEMAQLMQVCSVAVGAGGSTAWERNCMGLASVIISVAPNQTAASAQLGLMGAALYLGEVQTLDQERLQSALRCLLTTPTLRQHLAETARSLCDGLGTERVVKAMLQLKVNRDKKSLGIDFRPADLADTEVLRVWRNAPLVRNASANPNQIDEATHAAWMRDVLADRKRLLLVVRIEGKDVGCIRFDCDGSNATTSIYLAPSAIGLGLGSSIIQHACALLFESRPEITSIRAQVQTHNHASARAFTGAGFALDHQVFSKQRSTASPQEPHTS